MTPEEWQRIDEWVASALELGASQREVFLARVSAGDNALRREIESLIAANLKAEAKDFLGAAALANWGELFISEQHTKKTMVDNATALNQRYLIDRELGHGGIGVVYLARDQKLHSKYVVIKVLQEGSGRNDFWKQRFLREIEALARFENPHIVSILDRGELPDGSPFFVMEYIGGSNLRSVMKREGLDLRRVARLIRQISQAIGYAHERAVFHRDLKPENIMLTDNDDFVIIIDFGIATVKELRPATRDITTVVSGTPPYMAPEQLMGEPSAASDIWALGVLGYEMVTGRVPFELPKGDGWLTQLYKMQQAGVQVKPREVRTDLPEKAQEAILKGLSFDPKDRQIRAQDFGEDLAVALTGEPSEYARSPTTEKAASVIQHQTDETTLRKEPRFAEVVISYAAQDLSRALQLADRLRLAGISCWMADHGHEINLNDRSDTNETIKHCEVVLLLCSDVALRSIFVKQDMQLAWTYKRPFLPLLVERISFVEQAEYWLQGKQWIEVMDADPERWLPQVLWSLAKSGIRLNGADLVTLRTESIIQPIQLNHSLQSLRSIACFTDQIWPVPANRISRSTDRSLRGLGAPQDDVQHGHRLGSRVCLNIESDRAGYLLLLDEGPEGIIYCLCPSWFATEDRLEAGRSYLPQNGSRYDSFVVTGKPGREHLLAIVSDEQLGMDWMSTEPIKEPARVLNQADIDTLLARLRSLGGERWVALSTYFDVVI